MTAQAGRRTSLIVIPAKAGIHRIAHLRDEQHKKMDAETRSGGSRSWHNNNPGNIRSGSFANSHGAIGQAGGFAVFPDEETGLRASEALLRGRRYSGLTIDEAVARRSPPNENDTSRTQVLIGQFSGLSGTLKINDLNAAELARLNRAIQRAEGFIPGKVSRTQPPKPKN